MDILSFMFGFMTALVFISGFLAIRTLDREICKLQRKKNKRSKSKGTRELGSAYQAW